MYELIVSITIGIMAGVYTYNAITGYIMDRKYNKALDKAYHEWIAILSIADNRSKRLKAAHWFKTQWYGKYCTTDQWKHCIKRADREIASWS